MHYNFFEIVSEKYEELQKSVYKEKTRLLADKISKTNLLPVDHVTAAKSDATEKTIKKNERTSRLAIKVLSIAKSKDGDLARVLKYDITNYSTLFDASLMVKPIKNKMREELEKKAILLTRRLLWST